MAYVSHSCTKHVVYWVGQFSGVVLDLDQLLLTCQRKFGYLNTKLAITQLVYEISPTFFVPR